MRKIAIFVLIFGLGCTQIITAQKRQIDLEIILSEPSLDVPIISDEATQVKVSIKNNGPDNLIAGDSLFVYLVYLQQIIHIVLPQAINNAETFLILDQAFRFTLNGATFPTSANFCAVAIDPDSQSLEWTNGTRVRLSYSDPNLSNNTVCNQISIHPPEINSVKKHSNTRFPIQLYPNPASEYVMIKTEEQFYDLILTSIDGRVVARAATNNSTINLEIAQLAKGMYWIQLWDNKGVFIGAQKLIKE